MKKITDFLLSLLRLAIGNESVDSFPCCVDWNAVMKLSFDQGVSSIALDGVNRIINNVPEEIKYEWLGQLFQQEGEYEIYRKTISELASFYAEQGIKMMLIKGYGLSQYWPQPNHRPIGDIDIYLGHLWQFGDQMVHDRLGIEVECGHEHHTTFNFRGIMVENHYDFINTKAHKDAKRIEEKLKNLAAGTLDIRNEELGFALPSADFNVIFLIRHLGQHFAGEKVTLRQLLDWGLFLKVEGENVNWDDVTPFLKDMGIWTFFNQINAVCVDYLGIKFSDSVPSIERIEKLEKRIIEDVLHPEFAEEKPEGLIPVIWYKVKRWWHNRWKHPLVYDERLLPMFLTLIWSHLRRWDTIKN